MATLRHIALTVPDPEAAAAFYEQAFGLTRVGGTDWAGARGVYLSDGVVNLALLQYKTDAMAGERGRGYTGIHHLGFWVDSVADTRAAIEAAGGRYWMGEDKGRDGGLYEVKFHDPNGVVVDITATGWKGATKDPA